MPNHRSWFLAEAPQERSIKESISKSYQKRHGRRRFRKLFDPPLRTTLNPPTSNTHQHTSQHTSTHHPNQMRTHTQVNIPNTYTHENSNQSPKKLKATYHPPVVSTPVRTLAPEGSDVLDVRDHGKRNTPSALSDNLSARVPPRSTPGM